MNTSHMHGDARLCCEEGLAQIAFIWFRIAVPHFVHVIRAAVDEGLTTDFTHVQWNLMEYKLHGSFFSYLQL